MRLGFKKQDVLAGAKQTVDQDCLLLVPVNRPSAETWTTQKQDGAGGDPKIQNSKVPETFLNQPCWSTPVILTLGRVWLEFFDTSLGYQDPKQSKLSERAAFTPEVLETLHVTLMIDVTEGNRSHQWPCLHHRTHGVCQTPHFQLLVLGRENGEAD